MENKIFRSIYITIYAFVYLLNCKRFVSEIFASPPLPYDHCSPFVVHSNLTKSINCQNYSPPPLYFKQLTLNNVYIFVFFFSDQKRFKEMVMCVASPITISSPLVILISSIQSISVMACMV